MNPIKQNSASGAIPVRCLFLWGSLKSPAKMEFDSRLDEKPISCGKNQGQQSVTLQYLYSGVHL
jgi:hypothetical protein